MPAEQTLIFCDLDVIHQTTECWVILPTFFALSSSSSSSLHKQYNYQMSFPCRCSLGVHILPVFTTYAITTAIAFANNFLQKGILKTSPENTE